jgi:transposase
MDYNQLLENRRIRGMKIIKSQKLKYNGSEWIVPSQSGHGSYIVKLEKDMPTCSCPDYEKRRIKCKHQFAVEIIVKKQIDQEGNVTVTKKVTYSQEWSSYDKAQIQQKEMFLKLLNDLCKTIPNPTYSFGRPRMPLSDMIFSSALKVFTTFSLRRFATDMKLAKGLGYIDKTPYFTTVARYMENPELTPMLKELVTITSLPLKAIEQDFTIDSSGFTTTRFARWFDYKYGKEKDKRIWIKAQLMSGVKTNIVTAIELTITPEHDSKFLQPLMIKTAQHFQIKELSADMGYSSRDNLNAINEIGAMPYIPFKKNTTPKALGSSTWHKMWYYFMYKYGEFTEHYHKRSNAETVFHMIKSKFGDAIRSKTETAQINEVLLKVLCHNICVVIHEMFELGIEPNFFVAKV